MLRCAAGEITPLCGRCNSPGLSLCGPSFGGCNFPGHPVYRKRKKIFRMCSIVFAAGTEYSEGCLTLPSGNTCIWDKMVGYIWDARYSIPHLTSFPRTQGGAPSQYYVPLAGFFVNKYLPSLHIEYAYLFLRSTCVILILHRQRISTRIRSPNWKYCILSGQKSFEIHCVFDP